MNIKNNFNKFIIKLKKNLSKKTNTHLILKHNNSQVFDVKNYHQVKMQVNKLRFSKLYGIKKMWQRYLISILMSMCIALFSWLFLQYTGVYSAGISSFSQGFSRLSKVLLLKDHQTLANIDRIADSVYNAIFWLSYLLLNIPLAIFAYYKVGKNFAKITIVGAVVADVFGFGLGEIPNSNQIVQIFGDPLSGFKDLDNAGVQILLWKNTIGGADLQRVISLLFYGVTAGLLFPIFYSMLYIVGGSTGGTDFISYYYSLIKQKSLGTFLIYFNVISLLIGVFIGTYLGGSLARQTAENPNYNRWALELFLSPNLIVSTISSLIMGLLINVFFPKHKMVQLKIYSNNVQLIAKHLFSISYTHGITITDNVGAFLNKPGKTAETILQYIELPEVIREIQKVDKTCLMTVNTIDHIHGQMNLHKKID